MAFKSNLTKIFSAYDFQELGRDIRLQFANTAVDEGLKIAIEKAPEDTSKYAEEPILKQNIYSYIKDSYNVTTAVVAIKRDIKYAFALIFGDKRHNPNAFMKMAKQSAYKKAKALFRKIGKDAMIKMNNAARGKL